MPEETDEVTTDQESAVTDEGSIDEESTVTDDSGSDTDGTTISEDDFESLPEKTKKEIRKLRADVAKARTTAKQQAAEEARVAAEAAAQARIDELQQERDGQLKQIAKLLGLAKDEAAELTPEQVIEQITAERDAERLAREGRESAYLNLLREVAVQDAAEAHGVDSKKLINSRSFWSQVEGLDASDEKAFRLAVMEAVAEESSTDASLKLKKTAISSVSGGTTVAGKQPKDLSDMSVDEMIKAGFTSRR